MGTLGLGLQGKTLLLPFVVLHEPLRCALHLLGNSWAGEHIQIFTKLLNPHAGLATAPALL